MFSNLKLQCKTKPYPSTFMELPSLAVLAAAWLLSIAIISKIFKSQRHRNSNPPPGPKPWPIIGNLSLIDKLPHQCFHKLSQKYGPIMQLKLGSFPVVVASSSEMAKNFLKTYDHIFASRPPTASFKHIMYNFSNCTSSPYGAFWRQGRKIYLTELFSPKRLESLHHIRVEERREFLSNLYALSGQPVVLKAHLYHLSLSVISRMVLGKKYISRSKNEGSMYALEEFEEMLEEFFILNGAFNIGDWIPWLNFLDLQGYVKRMKALRKRFDRIYDHVYDEHRARRKEEKDFVPKDMADLLLELAEGDDIEVKLSDDAVKGFTQELIAGGTDTAAVSMEWAMAELLKQPHVIKKAAEELDAVIGKERWVEENDIPQLPYIEAIMKEAMRLHPAAVFLAPHFALEDCRVSGYDIKKGSRVYINTWSIGRDPSVWDRPEEFIPERFIGKDIDVKGQNFELLPFGSGRRMCPGYNLGLKMISVSLANMLHGFNWRLPDGMKTEDLDMDECYGLTTSRKFPLVAVVEPRLPLHLY